MDEDGSLDVSRVTTAGSQLFDCVGEDAAGNSAGYRIRVISVDPEQGGGLKNSETNTILSLTRRGGGIRPEGVVFHPDLLCGWCAGGGGSGSDGGCLLAPWRPVL